jgi:hypothetical protein
MVSRQLTTSVCLILWAAAPVPADDDLVDRLEQATSRLTGDTCRLKYKFAPGETLRYQVEHLATVETRIAGDSQEQKSRSVSTKAWRVEQVGERGITFVHKVEDVDMWSKVSGREEVRYNSRQGQKPPPEYEHVAQSLNVPLATVTMDAHGQILQRESAREHPDLGFGGLVVPLPPAEISVGHTWTVPHRVKVRQRGGLMKEIRTQVRYRLEKLQTGVATISVQTQVLTPVNDPRIKSQLIQKLSRGEVKFDVDAGRVLSKRLDWDESVIGFNGTDSNMKYLARFTETLVASDAERTAEATRHRHR